MTRNAVAVIVACLYVAVSSWIVSTQGKAYRDALKQNETRSKTRGTTRSQPKADGRETGRVVAGPAADARPAPAPVDDEPQREEKPADTLLAHRSAREPRRSATVKRQRAVVPVPPKPHPSMERHADVSEPPGPKPADSVRLAFAKAVGADVSSVRPATIDPFWKQPFATRKWDVANLSAEEERRLGADLHEMVMNFIPRLENADAQERVEQAAEPILPARGRKDIDYQLFVLDSSAVNAFSHPGGYVYVTRGLLDWISQDENCALQFVLAHEIYHVDNKHALLCLQDPGVQALPYGTLQLFYLFIFPRGYYPEKLDFDADAWALQQLKRLQCTRRECLTFIRKLKGYAQANHWGLDRTSALPRSGQKESLFDNHFRAHPPTYRRVEKLEALADAISSKSP
ncbi:MAG: M48 family metalloprotease [Isosphaeraceae bacterium]